MNHKLILLFSFLTLSIFTNAQVENWRQSHLKEHANYYEIVNSQRARLALLPATKKNKKEIKQFERWAEFWGDRIMPDGSFVSPQLHYREWLKEKEGTAATSRTTGNPWVFIGPSEPPVSDIFFYPGLGRVNAIAISPSDINTMYAGAPSGGIWKTTDGGNSWSPKNETLPMLGISDIAIDPSNENVIYIATGDFDGGATPSLGVFKSTNGGDTWNITSLSATADASFVIGKLLIDPNNTSNILATTLGAIKRSTNAGVTWADVYNTEGINFNDIQYKTGSSSTIYATSGDGYFLKSTDNGANWTDVSNPVDFERLDIAQTPDDPNLILALSNFGVIYKSTNEGQTWSEIATLVEFDSQEEYNQEIAISPIDKDLVIVGGVNGWRSKDGGVNWELYLDGYWITGQPYFYVHSDHHEMKFLPNSNIVLNGNDGGVFKGDASADVPWTDLSSGLAITQYYCVSGTPQDADKLILGAQDNDVAVYNGATFTGQIGGSDGVEGIWDYTNSDIAWACSQAGIMERTMDGFVTTEELAAPEGAPFVWQLEIHPTDPTTLFGGFADINKSTDRGDNWTSLNSGIAVEIEAIAIAQSDANTIIISGDNSIKKTTNGGSSWSDVTPPQMGKVKDVVIHPTNTNEIYICYSGYITSKAYKSTDGGANWTDITGSLPNVPCYKMAYRTGDNELYLANDLGVYFRGESASDWEKLDNGLPNVTVTDLAINYAANKLRVSTFGRGLWEVEFDDPVGNEDYYLDASKVSISPNPTFNKVINLELDNLSGTSSVLIYNAIGGVVKHFDTSNTKESINLNKFAPGAYFVKVTNQGKSITKKVILN